MSDHGEGTVVPSKRTSLAEMARLHRYNRENSCAMNSLASSQCHS